MLELLIRAVVLLVVLYLAVKGIRRWNAARSFSDGRDKYHATPQAGYFFCLGCHDFKPNSELANTASLPDGEIYRECHTCFNAK